MSPWIIIAFLVLIVILLLIILYFMWWIYNAYNEDRIEIQNTVIEIRNLVGLSNTEDDPTKNKPLNNGKRVDVRRRVRRAGILSNLFGQSTTTTTTEQTTEST